MTVDRRQWHFYRRRRNFRPPLNNFCSETRTHVDVYIARGLARVGRTRGGGVRSFCTQGCSSDNMKPTLGQGNSGVKTTPLLGKNCGEMS